MAPSAAPNPRRLAIIVLAHALLVAWVGAVLTRDGSFADQPAPRPAADVSATVPGTPHDTISMHTTQGEPRL
ncbi:MAG: hypothetical protein H0V44_08925 [Planctomycetes bacterium]|nr:hypothetical protein [Planctomycetota bacterium]